MTLSIQTFAALTSALAIVASIVSFPAFGIAALFIIPLVVLGIALSSPQKGTQLDPSGSWTCKFLTKTWLFSILLLICGVLILALSPSLGARVSRMMTSGDMRTYRVPIRLEVSTQDEARLRGKTWSVRDSVGTVGELRHVHLQVFYKATGVDESTIVGFLSTDRSTYNQSYDANVKFSVTFGEDNIISLKQVASPAP